MLMPHRLHHETQETPPGHGVRQTRITSVGAKLPSPLLPLCRTMRQSSGMHTAAPFLASDHFSP